MMTKRLGVVMDPIHAIHYKKDSTLAMLWEAKARGYEIYYFEQKNLFLNNAIPYGDASILDVFKEESKWFSLAESKTLPLAELDVILMRKDPPFDDQYIYTTYLLEHAERLGVFVVNRPQSLRDANEKLFITYFPNCCPPTLVTPMKERLWVFLQEQRDIVCKRLNVMGGESVFRVKEGDVNANAIFDMLTQRGREMIMSQRFIPEIKEGDKRILMINGQAFPHALVRVPQGNEWRGNLALGAKGIVKPLTKRDHEICEAVGPELKKRGLYFVGLDIIGDYLTEINVTSPTCIRELEAATHENISAMLFDVIEQNV